MATVVDPIVFGLLHATINSLERFQMLNECLKSIQLQSQPLERMYLGVWISPEIKSQVDQLNSFDSLSVVYYDHAKSQFAGLRELFQHTQRYIIDYATIQPEHCWIMFSEDSGLWNLDRVAVYQKFIKANHANPKVNTILVSYVEDVVDASDVKEVYQRVADNRCTTIEIKSEPMVIEEFWQAVTRYHIVAGFLDPTYYKLHDNAECDVFFKSYLNQCEGIMGYNPSANLFWNYFNRRHFITFDKSRFRDVKASEPIVALLKKRAPRLTEKQILALVGHIEWNTTLLLPCRTNVEGLTKIIPFLFAVMRSDEMPTVFLYCYIFARKFLAEHQLPHCLRELIENFCENIQSILKQ